MGVRTVSIEDKVRKEAERRVVYDPEDYFLVKPEDFRLMYKTIQSMRLCESAAVGDKGKEGKEGDFVAILWQWQVLLTSPLSCIGVCLTFVRLLTCSSEEGVQTAAGVQAQLPRPQRREAAQTLSNLGRIWYERQIYDKALAIG